MINYHRWSDSAYELVFEKSAFYYCSGALVAFRESGSKKIFVKESNMLYFKGPLSDFVQMLSVTGNFFYMSDEDFFNASKALYAKAILRGVKRIGLDILFPKKNKGEKENVVNVKSNAG